MGPNMDGMVLFTIVIKSSVCSPYSKINLACLYALLAPKFCTSWVANFIVTHIPQECMSLCLHKYFLLHSPHTHTQLTIITSKNLVLCLSYTGPSTHPTRIKASPYPTHWKVIQVKFLYQLTQIIHTEVHEDSKKLVNHQINHATLSRCLNACSIMSRCSTDFDSYPSPILGQVSPLLRSKNMKEIYAFLTQLNHSPSVFHQCLTTYATNLAHLHYWIFDMISQIRSPPTKFTVKGPIIHVNQGCTSSVQVI